MRYDAVVFDLFGTLIDTFTFDDYHETIAEMADALDASFEPFLAAWIESFRPRIIGDFKSTTENIRHIAGDIGISPTEEQLTAVEELRHRWTREWITPRPDAIATLERLRELGHRIGLISDCSIEVPSVWPETDFPPYFDATVFSASVGMKKPDPRIYQLACKQLGVEPDRCLYVGDGSSRELTGAKEVGMTPVLIEAPHDEYFVDRQDALEWKGPKIKSLSEVLSFVQ
jgi:putative hydrolase of the HAD superfamily